MVTTENTTALDNTKFYKIIVRFVLSKLIMPTILFIYGWRLFFYSNEGTEPIHIHVEKADMECKYWIFIDEVEIKEEFAFNLTPAAKREIKKIIYQHFDLIVESWNKHFKNK